MKEESEPPPNLDYFYLYRFYSKINLKEINKEIWHNPKYCTYLGKCSQGLLCKMEDAERCSLKELYDEERFR